MVRFVAIAAVLLLSACAAQAPSLPRTTQVETRRAIEYDYDILIKGGTIYDGSGGKPYVADIGVKDGLINAVYPKLKGDAAVEIDARGRAVAPGFIGGGDLQDGFVVTAARCIEPSLDATLLPEAVRRMTSGHAERLHMKERGRLMPGWAADIVVFDPSGGLPQPAAVKDVIMGGVMVLEDGKVTRPTELTIIEGCG
jgi:adenine deaminase